MFSRLLLVCVLLFSVSACFRQHVPTEDATPSPVADAEPSTWVIVLDGYDDGDFRRVFQEQLRVQGLEVELLNAGAHHAEYQVMLTSVVQPHWRQNLLQFLGERYLLQQDGERLLFIRQ